jgi:tRNA threonylcarbamoyladenosine biosynthesis protein TsaB
VLLAVDTSTQWVGLALYDGLQVISEEVWMAQNHHTVELSPALATLFKRSGVATSQLRALGVAVGPGAFTSLRIGLGVVKGMALALHLPVVGVPTLDILAAAQPVQNLPMAVVLQAGWGRLAVGWYRKQEVSRDPHNAEADHRGADGQPQPAEGADANLPRAEGPRHRKGRLSAVWAAQGEARVMTVEELSQSIRRPTIVCGELSGAERQILARKRKTILLASPAQAIRRPAYLAEIAWRRWQAGQVDDPVTLAPVYLHIADPIPA